MTRFLGPLVAVLLVIAAAWFAALNGDQRITLSLGFVTLYRMPVTLVAFLGLFVGMVTMWVAGIHSDLKVRSILRDRLAEETSAEQARIDRLQRDLFRGDPEEDADP